jgi:hypothetical protein
MLPVKGSALVEPNKSDRARIEFKRIPCPTTGLEGFLVFMRGFYNFPFDGSKIVIKPSCCKSIPTKYFQCIALLDLEYKGS